MRIVDILRSFVRKGGQIQKKQQWTIALHMAFGLDKIFSIIAAIRLIPIGRG